MLRHVPLETDPTDIAAAVAFWGLLGFVEVEPPETLRETTSWLQRDGSQIHLLRSQEPVAPCLGHAAVIVDVFESVYTAIEAAGHPIERRREHWGAARAFATAPGGHPVELMAAPPPA